MALVAARDDLGRELDKNLASPRLPAEICSLVLSHARLGSQAAAARASRLFFCLTIPHLWSNADIDIKNILGLLPGSSQNAWKFE
ncbi:hypothetical protein FRC06_004646, partial [Ceratobasidium sp. 370]